MSKKLQQKLAKLNESLQRGDRTEIAHRLDVKYPRVWHAFQRSEEKEVNKLDLLIYKEARSIVRERANAISKIM